MAAKSFFCPTVNELASYKDVETLWLILAINSVAFRTPICEVVTSTTLFNHFSQWLSESQTFAHACDSCKNKPSSFFAHKNSIRILFWWIYFSKSLNIKSYQTSAWLHNPRHEPLSFVHGNTVFVSEVTFLASLIYYYHCVSYSFFKARSLQ